MFRVDHCIQKKPGERCLTTETPLHQAWSRLPWWCTRGGVPGAWGSGTWCGPVGYPWYGSGHSDTPGFTVFSRKMTKFSTFWKIPKMTKFSTFWKSRKWEIIQLCKRSEAERPTGSELHFVLLVLGPGKGWPLWWQLWCRLWCRLWWQLWCQLWFPEKQLILHFLTLFSESSLKCGSFWHFSQWWSSGGPVVSLVVVQWCQLWCQ